MSTTKLLPFISTILALSALLNKTSFQKRTRAFKDCKLTYLFINRPVLESYSFLRFRLDLLVVVQYSLIKFLLLVLTVEFDLLYLVYLH